jgi:hypothetical protein
VLWLAACSSTLPMVRPPKMQIDFDWSAGMMPMHHRLTLSADGCEYTERNGATERRARFQLSPAELDAIYRVLRDNKLDRITTDDELAMDKGGYSVALSWPSNAPIAVTEGGRFIAHRWIDEWKRITDALEAIAKAHQPSAG